MTKDVLGSLKQFVANAGQSGEDQPLEAYLQRMKQHMAKRLYNLHSEQMATAASGYEEKLSVSEFARVRVEICVSIYTCIDIYR